ncbi:hypothetical protein PSHT_00958, partial [Puccinia striiformis]
SPDHEAARASLIRKVDWHVLQDCLSSGWPASVGGMDHSLGLHGMQYNIGLAVFYVTYIASELPSNYMLRVLGGKVGEHLCTSVLNLRIITIFSGFMKNYASLIVVRLLLGLFEGGLLPVVYLSTMYRRNELQLRVGIFFASASLSGAFGGLLAYGIDMMEGLSGQKASLETASFLTPEEREFAVARLKFVPKLNQKTLPLEVEEAQADSLTSTQGADVDADAGATAEDKTAPTPRDLTRFETEKLLPLLNPDVKVGHETDGSSPVEKFEKYEIIRAFKEPQVWFTGIGYMSLCVGMYSYSLFLCGWNGFSWNGCTALLIISISPGFGFGRDSSVCRR